ncbi:MAG: galactosyltransferase-related protein [Rahnella inusitata]|jgi:predicted glycosyltransferase involved in capsule biosynthesis|uniref:galactosyltransferase-related protein n=1 Tax=Rahnella inusitata TaxID=58169 RepID=UPI002F3AF844
MFTVIIPVDLCQRASDITSKAIKIAQSAESSNIKIIIAHNDRAKKYDDFFLKSLAKFEMVNIISDRFYEEGVNSSILRNIAFNLVDSEHVVLLDVDIWPDFNLIEKYSRRITNNCEPFYILPCLYLTKFGSQQLSSNKLTVQQLKSRFYNFSRKEFLHLASPSSVTIMKTKDYKFIGGFDTDFSGHGYEDFDFLVRLLIHYKKIKSTTDFFVNKTARSPLFLEGFRRHLGEVCLETLIEKDMVFHLYHSKPIDSQYYAARPDNFITFASKHSSLIGDIPSKDSTLITKFVELCNQKKIDIQDYSILFDNKPGHIDRFDTFKRRLKFLMNR